MVIAYVFDLSFIKLRMDIILKAISCVLFIISMIYYSKIIIMLNKVTDITRKMVLIAIISHVATLTAIYMWGNNIGFYLLFLGSIFIREVTDVKAIDREMKSLCYQLDLKLFEIGKEQGL